MSFDNVVYFQEPAAAGIMFSPHDASNMYPYFTQQRMYQPYLTTTTTASPVSASLPPTISSKCKQCGRCFKGSLESHLMDPRHSQWVSRKTAKSEISIAYEKLSVASLDLPVVVFDGEHPQEDEAISKCLEHLWAEPVLGLDCEWIPDRQKGISNPIELIQIATPSVVYLWRLSVWTRYPSLHALLKSAVPLKVGVGIDCDLSKLSKVIGEVDASGYCDLGREAPIDNSHMFRGHSLKKLVARFLNLRVEKKMQCSDWSAAALSVAQIQYAALDAWLPLRMFQSIFRNDIKNFLGRRQQQQQRRPPSQPLQAHASNSKRGPKYCCHVCNQPFQIWDECWAHMNTTGHASAITS